MKLSQTQKILKRLELGDEITPITGICMEPPILRIGARIEELRRKGRKIISIKVKRKDGKFSPICGYVLFKFFDKKKHERFFDE